MLEAILLWLAIAFVVVPVVGVAGFFALRWIFIRAAERMVTVIDRASAASRRAPSLGIVRYAQASGIDVEEAKRLFGAHIDRLAKIMDSAVTLPIVGRVGLDAVLDLIPVFGNFAGAAISLTLIARTPEFGPAPSLVSRMLSTCSSTRSLRHSAVGPLRRPVVQGERPDCEPYARVLNHVPPDRGNPVFVNRRASPGGMLAS